MRNVNKIFILMSAQKKDRMIQFYLVFNMQKVLIR